MMKNDRALAAMGIVLGICFYLCAGGAWAQDFNAAQEPSPEVWKNAVLPSTEETEDISTVSVNETLETESPAQASAPLAEPPQETKAVPKAAVAVETRVFEFRYVKAREAAGDLREVLTENIGRLEVAEEDNKITVTDTPSKLEALAKIIVGLDRPAQEILLEIKVLQIILNDEHPKGIDWEAIVSDFQTLGFEGFRRDPQGRLSFGTLTEEDYAVLLDALDTVGFINTVSNIKITTADGKSSEVVLQPADLLSAYEREEKDGEAAEENNIEYQLVPKLLGGQRLSVRVVPKAADRQEAREGLTLDVAGGTTIVVGGLFKKVTVESTRKIPLLGDLPLLGFAFRSHGERFRETEVIVFVTPKAIVKE